MNQTLARAIAALLPGNWTVEPLQNDLQRFYLVDSATQTKIFLAPSYRDEKRISISLSVPRYNSDTGELSKHGSEVPLYKDSPAIGKEDQPSITVSASKSTEQIAKDIERRVLPEAIRLTQKALAYTAKVRETYASKKNGGKAIADIFGVEFNPERPLTRCKPYHHTETYHGEFQPSHDGSKVDFKIHSLPHDKALKLAAFLKAEIFN